MRITPNCGRERARCKTWGRKAVAKSRFKAMKLFKADLGAFKFNSFLPKKNTAMKSATQPLSMSRSVWEVPFRGFAAGVGAESWPEWPCCTDTWLLNMEWHWCAITIPVENTAKKMAKSRANCLLLLATMRMEKLYQLRVFGRLIEKGRCWIVTENTLPRCS